MIVPLIALAVIVAVVGVALLLWAGDSLRKGIWRG